MYNLTTHNVVKHFLLRAKHFCKAKLKKQECEMTCLESVKA